LKTCSGPSLLLWGILTVIVLHVLVLFAQAALDTHHPLNISDHTADQVKCMCLFRWRWGRQWL
jgi:hypothetical protein